MTHKIGNLTLKNRIFLAPMHEPNDIAFRMLCSEAGSSLVYTGLLSPLSHQNLILDDKPAVQLFGTNPDGFKKFIKKHDHEVSLWDFNLGCPSVLSAKFSHGAYMHGEMEMLREIFTVMRASTTKPCTVKLRKSSTAISIAILAEKCGFDAVGIHPRTKNENYSDEPDYDFALKLKASIKIPVIYSGSVELNNYEKILRDFDFVFIGRSCIGNPNMFSKMLGLESSIKFSNYLELAKKYDIFFRQIKYQAMMFSHGMKNAKDIRRGLIKAKTVDDVIEVMN